jgi:Rad3-related DNA helicase
MSATIGHPKTYIKVMGIENANVIKLSNDFNYEKSPIIFVNRFKMSMQHKEKSLPEAIKILDQILSKHKDQRGLIHTGSYEFTQYIKQHSNHIRRIIEYKNSSEKEDALIKFKKGVNGIIMGPSILEGLDFNDESCRFQIFFKIPFPSLGDPLTIAKMKGSPGWYDWKTGVTIEQGIGRSVRNSKDWAITYILDACFNNIMHKTDFLSEDLKNRIKVIK